ncbi:MAG: hypothetical protein QMC95_09150 [Desulfitobacteriaceae bacterium]|nr:hypothetical protein [Desulfitobacteriaceae bacterium]
MRQLPNVLPIGLQDVVHGGESSLREIAQTYSQSIGAVFLNIEFRTHPIRDGFYFCWRWQRCDEREDLHVELKWL